MSDNEAFYRVKCASEEEWLKERAKHLQASDAAAIMGLSPWASASELFDQKSELVPPKDISGKPYVIYGKRMEEHIREAALLDLPYFECDYHQYDILVNRERTWQACTLDGELTVVSDNPWNLPIGSKGILECKTGQWKVYKDLQDWIEFPIHYHVQQCHQLAVTEWNFNLSASRVVRAPYREDDNGFPEVKTLYHIITMRQVLDDIVKINTREADFWESLKKGIRPRYRLGI